MRPASTARQVGFRRLMGILFGLVVVVVLLRVGPLAPEGAPRAANTPGVTTPAAPTAAGSSVPRCTRTSRPARHIAYDDWARTLVDTSYRLPPDYQPPDLVSAGAAGFGGPFTVREMLLEDLSALREAAELSGNPIELAAAHRTFEQQAFLFEQRERQLGREEALKVVALPGHSEHQLGTTVDFKTAGAEDVDLTWASTPAGAWTIQHAPEFGFVLSYPQGRQAKTCYRYEPWHFRYFGRARAAAIVASGLTPREFLWLEARED